MTQLFKNAARSALQANILSTDTSITVASADADLYPVANTNAGAVGTPGLDWFKVVLQDTAGNIEIVYVRTRALGVATFTNCQRGQEGTTARAYLAGSIVGLRLTASDLQAAIDLAASATTAGKLVLNAADAAAQRVAIAGAGYGLTDRTAIAAGTVDAITAAFTPAITAFDNGPIFWRASGANTSTTPTLKRDGLAAKTIVKGANTALKAGEIPGAGAWMFSQYDVTLDKEVLLNPASVPRAPQTWQNVTASRAASTTYTNTTTEEITVSVFATAVAGNESFTGTVAGVTVAAATGSGAAGYYIGFSLQVPAGATYAVVKVGTPSITTWFEKR